MGGDICFPTASAIHFHLLFTAFLFLSHFPFLAPLADLVIPLPAAISQLQQSTITCKLTPLLCLILDELIFTLFLGPKEVPGKTPETLLMRSG